MLELDDIIKTTNARVQGHRPGIRVKSISTDSRDIKKGSLFIALKGAHFDGKNFIGQAVDKGAAAIMINASNRGMKKEKIPLLYVQDTKQALSVVAQLHRERFDIPFITVVGSNGKTTTKDILSHILATCFDVLKTHANNNNGIGVAKTLLDLNKQDVAVIECGTNSLGEIEHAAKTIKPDMAITTNIGLSHLAGLKTRSGIFKEKIAMVKNLKKKGIWIRNCDDKALFRKNYSGIKIVDFGIDNKAAHYRAVSIRHTGQGMEFRIKGKSFFLPLIGIHNIYNGLAAIAAASFFMSLDDIRKALLSFKAVPMRLQVQDCGTFLVIDDTYNANPDSFKCAVKALKDLYCQGRKIFVAADMFELGDQARELHYQSGLFLAKAGAADTLVVFGRYAKSLAYGALTGGMRKADINTCTDKKDIVRFLKRIIDKGDIVLVKGSRNMKMEDIIHCFTTYSIH
jgi:UDP-N-acetylmuramoyl-tripeptide--D-alanyl-D-alanine ligase